MASQEGVVVGLLMPGVRRHHDPYGLSQAYRRLPSPISDLAAEMLAQFRWKAWVLLIDVRKDALNRELSGLLGAT